MEDSFGKWMNLVATVFAFVALTATDAVVARVSNAAFGANRQLAVGEVKHIVQTSCVIWEAFVEVFNRKLHTTSVLQRLHVVKG